MISRGLMLDAVTVGGILLLAYAGWLAYPPIGWAVVGLAMLIAGIGGTR